MGNKLTTINMNYEDLQNNIRNSSSIIINTLPLSMQSCLILNTLPFNQEEEKINGLLKNNVDTVNIIIYGMNNCDETVYKKYKQLQELGFRRVYMYLGGMFEWMLLQDIYGKEDFPTTEEELDILKFKPKKVSI
jgi:hypothetical protein